MSRLVQIILGLTAISSSLLSMILAQSSDHFLPPAPSLWDRPRRIVISDNSPFSKNKYLSEAFPGAWFRSNFQDLLSYRGAQKLEWFEVLEGNDCTPVPATVNAGRPPRDICLNADAEERRCICVNTGRTKSTKTRTGYEQICGTCRNPCLFKFTPDDVPPYVQKLASQKDDDDYFYEDYEYDDDDKK